MNLAIIPSQASLRPGSNPIHVVMLTWAFAACAAGAPATEETAATPAAAPAPFRKPRRPTPVVDKISVELAEAISCVIFPP